MRNGRSFLTRRVTARQSVGVILEMTASYQVDEDAPEVQTAMIPDTPPPEELDDDSWSPLFDRRVAPRGRGETSGWLRVAGDIDPGDRALQACGLAYLSDDLPTEAVVSLHPDAGRPEAVRRPVHVGQPRPRHLLPPARRRRPVAPAGLHLPRADELAGRQRGLRVHRDGTHVATVVQEVLLRKLRRLPR